ncbi:TetR/AcrR family transcriptional regulator [Mesorhizobium sp. A556]
MTIAKIKSQDRNDRITSDTSKRDVILDQAAILFACKEFEGTSMRDIARMADVSQSLIHYHYETKEQLFEAVFDRHMTEMNRHRMSLISDFMSSKNPDEEQSIEKLIEILIKPWIDLTNDEREPTREFAKFVIRSAYHDDEWSRTVAVKYFDEVQRTGVKAFKAIIPEFDNKAAFRAYFFTLSMFYMSLSARGRLSALAGGDTDMADSGSLLHHGVCFAAAGIRAMRAEISGRTVHE